MENNREKKEELERVILDLEIGTNINVEWRERAMTIERTGDNTYNVITSGLKIFWGIYDNNFDLDHYCDQVDFFIQVNEEEFE